MDKRLSAKTTRDLAYAGFVVAVLIAILALILNRDLTGAGVMCGMFLALTGVHAARRAFGKQEDRNDNGNIGQ